MTRLHIDAQADHVLRLAHKSDPVRAVIELIWNSLDAEADRVDVVFQRSEMGAIEAVSIIDTGHGIPPEAIKASFENLGGSWKVRAKVSPNINRVLNGRYGRGRIRGFALGDAIRWTTVADDLTGERKRSIISGNSSDPTNFQDEESMAFDKDKLGTVFAARYPSEHVNRLTAESAIPRITAAFALFLTSNSGVTICFDGHNIDPKSAERHRAEYEIEGFAKEIDEPAPILRIIEWKKDAGRSIYLCDENGVVLDNVIAGVRTPGYNFTAYILWSGFRDSIQYIQLAELHGDDSGTLIAAARERIVEHFHLREAERRAELIRQWIVNGEYPYSGNPAGEAERAEREVFDFVATMVAPKIPNSRVSRKTTLYFLREAVASEPSSLPRILDDLFSLPRSQHEDLQRLLDRTTMSKLIAANTVIMNRLDFLAALREMVFDPKTKNRVKERKELHKILEREAWIFGEDYGLTLSDKGLDEVLERHLQKLRPGTRRKPGNHVLRSDGSRGIVDLMLSQQRVGVNVTENLVVELKRPNVTITSKEVGQIKGYAQAVADDSQFLGRNIRWDFWIISTKMDPVVTRDAQAGNHAPGLIGDWGEGVRIWAKTWSQVIGDCEGRLRHHKKILEHDASHEHAAEYLNRAHVPETIPEPFLDNEEI